MSLLKQLFGKGASQKKHKQEPEKVKSYQLIDKVAKTEYIQNLRIGRSWILPQMVEMCFDKNGNFSEKRYLKKVSELDFEKCWSIMMRNVRALRVLSVKDPTAYNERLNWWNKEVFLSMAKYDFKFFVKYLNERRVLHCSGGPYVYLPNLKGTNCRYDKMFFTEQPSSEWRHEIKLTSDLKVAFEKRIEAIANANDVVELLRAVDDYDQNRCIVPVAERNNQSLTEFVNAYIGDGAYSAMMTMVKFLNLTYADNQGRMLSREECISDIASKLAEFGCNGLLMFRYCSSKLLDSSEGGTFNYKDYCKR